MNRIVEFIIRAKDATGAAIKSAKASISALVKHAESEFSKVDAGLGKVDSKFGKFAGGIKKGLGPLVAISSAFGMMEGAAGKAARTVSAVASAAMAFGPLGAVVAGAQVIISHFSAQAKEEADAILKKANEMAAQVEKRSAQIKASILESIAGAFDAASKAADTLLHQFDRLAQKRAGLQKAELGMFSAQGQSRILEMQRQMEADVAASDSDTKAYTRAEWQLKIAKEKAQITKQENEYRAKMEAESIRNEQERIELAERAAERYERAADAADENYQIARKTLGANDDYTRNLERQREAALRQAEAEREKAEDIQARLDVAIADNATNAVNRANAESANQNEIEKAERDLLDAEEEYYRRITEAEEEYYRQVAEDEQKRIDLEEEWERERIEAERKLHEQKMKDARAEIDLQLRASEQEQSNAQTRLQAAQAAVSRAWGWYRDKASMQSEIDAYNEQKAAEVQWEKDFQRLKDKRRDWRDIEFGKLSAEEEAVRQVALAKEEEKAAQVALDEIAENTAYLKEIAESLTAEEGA